MPLYLPTSHSGNTGGGSISRQLDNIKTRLNAVGSGNTDSRNWFEKLTNLPKDQNALFDVLDLIQRPSQAISNTVSSLVSPTTDTRQPFQAALDGITGRKKVSYSNILGDLGVKNKYVKNGLGLALDIGLDPTTYIPASWIAKGAKYGAKGISKLLPETVNSGLHTMGQGVEQMFGGKFAGLDDAGKQIGKDIESSQRYLTDKVIKETSDLKKEYGNRPVGDLSMGDAVGRMQEKDLKIIHNTDELVKSILKGENPRFNLMNEDSVNIVNELNKALKESPEVRQRVKNEFTKVKKLQTSLAKINDKQDIKSLLEKNAKLKEATSMHDAGMFDEMLAKGYHLDELHLTDQEHNIVAKIEDYTKRIQDTKNKIKDIGMGVKIRPVAETGKGVMLDNPYARLFNNASVDTGKVLDNVSPLKSIDEFIPNGGKAAVNTLITTGKLVLPKEDASLASLQAMFKDEIKVVTKNNTTVTLKNPEKYAGVNVDELKFPDRIQEVQLPRPQREMSQNADVSLVAKKLTDGNAEIRDTMAKFGFNIANIEGFMKHILSEELAKNASKSGVAKIGGNKAVVAGRNYKGSAEDVNDLQGIKLFDTDAFFSSAIGRKKLIEYAHAEALKNQLLDRYGKVFKDGMTVGKDEAIIRPKDFNFFQTEGGNLAVSKADSYVVPKAVASVLHNWKRTITDEGVNKFLKGYDALQNVWKKFALFSGGFHIRNDLGNTFNMWISGMPLAKVFGYKAKAIADLSRIREIERLNNIGRKLTPKQQAMFDEYDDFLRQGLKEGSIFENEFRFKGGVHEAVQKAFDHNEKSAVGKVLDNLKRPDIASRNLGTNVDEVSRYALYRFEKAKAIAKGEEASLASKIAANKVREVLFDYSDLSQLEHGIRRVIPFYTWMRNNIPFQLKNFMLSPAKYSNADKVVNAANDATGMDESLLPDWMKESFALPVSGDGKGGGKLLNLNLPLSDLTKLTNPVKMLSDSLTPMIKTPIELSSNINTFLKKPIESFKGEKETMFGIDLPVKLAYMIKQLGAVRNLSGYSDKATKGDMKGLVESFASGGLMKTQDTDKAKLSKLYDQLNELQDIAKKYKQDTGKELPTLKDLGK